MGNILSKGTDYTEGSTVTATNLNEHVEKANFVAGAGNTTDDSSLEVHSGHLRVKDGGITSAKLASDALTGGDGGSTIVVNNNNFTDNTISGGKLVDASISSDKLIMETDAYTGVKRASSGIAFDPSTIKIFTTKVARMRTICFEITFWNGSDYPLMSTPTNSDNITFQVTPPAGKDWEIFDLGTITSALDGNHYPFGGLRIEAFNDNTYDLGGYDNTSNGWVSFGKSGDETFMFIFLSRDYAGKYLHSLRGSLTFPTSS